MNKCFCIIFTAMCGIIGIESSCLEGCRLNAQAVAADVANITNELLQDAVSPEKRVTMS
jgi:hypothetical protein